MVLSMSANEFTEVPHTVGCKISQGIVCYKWLQSDGAISNRRAINHSNLSILEVLATLIGSYLAKEPTASPVAKLRTNVGYQFWYPMQNGYQIW